MQIAAYSQRARGCIIIHAAKFEIIATQIPKGKKLSNPKENVGSVTNLHEELEHTVWSSELLTRSGVSGRRVARSAEEETVRL